MTGRYFPQVLLNAFFLHYLTHFKTIYIIEIDICYILPKFFILFSYLLILLCGQGLLLQDF